MAQPSTDFVVFTKGGKPNEGFIGRIARPERLYRLYCLKMQSSIKFEVVCINRACVDRDGTMIIDGSVPNEQGRLQLTLSDKCSPKIAFGGSEEWIDRENMQQIFNMLAADNPWIAKTFGMTQPQ